MSPDQRSGKIFQRPTRHDYDNLSTALQSITTEEFVESPTSQLALPFIGYIIAKGDTTDLSDTANNKIIQAGLFRNTAGSSGGGGAAVTNLNDLGDVTISSPSTGQALVYNAGLWVNGIPASASYAATSSFSNNFIVSGSLDISGSLTINGTSYTAATSGTTIFRYTELRDKVIEACHLSVQLEFDFIDKAFEMGNIEGLTKEQLKNFIKARANDKMVELGYKAIYNDIDPNLLKQIEWFGHLTSGKTHQDFFAGRVPSYAKSTNI